jgi:hypothetical protein
MLATCTAASRLWANCVVSHRRKIYGISLQHLKHVEGGPLPFREPVAIEQMRFIQPYFCELVSKYGVVRK